jgi:hypothetical protein
VEAESVHAHFSHFANIFFLQEIVHGPRLAQAMRLGCKRDADGGVCNLYDAQFRTAELGISSLEVKNPAPNEISSGDFISSATAAIEVGSLHQARTTAKRLVRRNGERERIRAHFERSMFRVYLVAATGR